MSNTLAETRQYLSFAVGDLILGQCGATGATTSIIHAPFLWQPTDYYNEHKYEVYVYAGTNVGITKTVTDWTLSTTHLLTVHSVYDNACDVTSYAELHYIFKADDYKRAINLAIEYAASGRYLIDKIDVATTLVADTYEYTLPSDMYYVHQITTEDEVAGGVFYEGGVIDHRFWRLISPRKLKLDEQYYSVTADKDLRIEGQGKQATASSDTSDIALPLDWLVNKAITYLPISKIQSGKLDNIYRKAVLDSAIIPPTWSNPRARSVVE